MSSILNLCRKMFEVGCIGFGGGNALIPILEDAFVDDNDNGETARNLDKDVIVANVTPGALPVEIVGSLGRRSHGITGMFVAPLMFTLPGILGTFLLLLFMSGVKPETLNLILVGAVGVSGFICSLLLEYMHRVFQSARQESKERTVKVWIVVIGITILISGGNIFKILGIDRTPFFGVSTLALLLAMFFWAFYVNTQHDLIHMGLGLVLVAIYLVGSGKNGLLADSYIFTITKVLMLVLAVGATARSFYKNKVKIHVEGGTLVKDVLLWVTFAAVLSLPSILINSESLEFAGRAFLSTLMSFGGGDAYLTIADGMFVNSGMISNEAFYGQIVTVVNVLPGSILCKCLFGMGFYLGNQIGGIGVGIALGLCGYACSVAASCGIFFLMYYLYDALMSFDSFNFISRWIRPVVVGLLIKVMLGLCTSNISLSEFTGHSTYTILAFTVLLTLTNYLFRLRNKNMNFVLVILDIAVSMAFLLI